MDIPAMTSLKKGTNDESESEGFAPSNPSMKRRKKSDTSRFGDAYSDSGIVGKKFSPEKKTGVDDKKNAQSTARLIP